MKVWPIILSARPLVPDHWQLPCLVLWPNNLSTCAFCRSSSQVFGSPGMSALIFLTLWTHFPWYGTLCKGLYILHSIQHEGIWALCFIRHLIVAYCFWGSILWGKSRKKCILNVCYGLFLFLCLFWLSGIWVSDSPCQGQGYFHVVDFQAPDSRSSFCTEYCCLPMSNTKPKFISPKRSWTGFCLLRWSEIRSNQRQESPEIARFTKPPD